MQKASFTPTPLLDCVGLSSFEQCEKANPLFKVTMTTATDSPDQDQNSPAQNPKTTQQEEHDQHQQNPQSDSHSQSPKTLTLETPDPINLDPSYHDQQDQPDQPQVSLDEDRNQDDSEMVTSSPPIVDLQITTATTATASRRCGPKRSKKRVAQEKKSRKKLEILIQTLKPIPFVPIKALDFSSHEKLLKRLGLWDFVHIELDQNLRADLIAQLIATFNSYQPRCSYVNETRIKVSRADLGRALKLPGKKDRVNALDNFVEVQESEESKGFMEELVSNWLLLHDDTWMMPSEVLDWIKMIKDGHFERLDWASMIWFMVEKELMTAPQLGNCYYASHLQYLIKCQKEELLREEPKLEVDVKEEEEEEEDGNGDLKMGSVDDLREPELDEHNIELSLGQEHVVKEDAEKERVGDEDVMDFEESKEEEHGQWLMDGKNNVDEHFFRRCNMDDVGGMDSEEEGNQKGGGGSEGEEEEGQEEEEEGDQDGEFHLSRGGDNLEGVTSVNLIAAMEAVQIPFSPRVGVEVRGDNSSGEFLASRVDTNAMPSGSSLFGNGNKRGSDHENDISHHPLNGGNKRRRSDGPWDDNPSSDFDVCIEQLQHLLGKTRMMYVAKERACEESSVNQQILINELHQRDNMIEHLHKAKLEEQQKRQVEVYRLERELYMMGNLLEDYRKALKGTHRAFAEYRARCPQPDEPLYKDVSGSGGLVLSTMDLEKQRLKQEEEEKVNRTLIEKKIKDFEVGWIGKLEAHKDRINSLGNRLLDVEKEVKLLKEMSANRKIPENSECALEES